MRWGGAGLRSKHYHRDLGNVMMSLVDLDVSRLQRGTPDEVGLMDYSFGRVYHEMMANFLLFSAFAGFVTSVLINWRNQRYP